MATPYVDLASIQSLSVGQVLTAALVQQIRDNFEALIDPPACSVYASAAQSVPNNDTTALTANSETFDNDTMHSTSSNTSRITATKAGRYLIAATVSFAADADGYRRVSLRVNGTTAYGGQDGITDLANTGVKLTVTRFLVLAAGDYVEVTCLHTAGANLNVTLEEYDALFVTR